MKVEIQISDDELRTMILERLANKAADHIWEGDRDHGQSWEVHNQRAKITRKEILAKVDWKNAGSQLSETVVRKFFEKLLENR